MRTLNEIGNELMDVVLAMMADPKLEISKGRDLWFACTENDNVYLRLDDGDWDNSLIGGWNKLEPGPHTDGDYARGGTGLHIGRNVDGMLSFSIYNPVDGTSVVSFSVVGF